MIRILVVEDDRMIAEGLRDDLELDGYEVDVVSDGGAAEKRALAGEHDLVLLDVMLPKRSGFDICRALRTAGVATPVIMLTAKGQEADRIRGLELGADDYIVKPFSPGELLARVRSVLRRARSAGRSGDDIWECDGLRVDFGRFEATRNGAALGLTGTEFKLLKALYEARGRVVTLEELLRRVWGADIFLTDRVVYTHVNNLRRKIKPDAPRPGFIRSVRGVGYRFES